MRGVAGALTLMAAAALVTGAELSRTAALSYAFDNAESIKELHIEQNRATAMRKEYNASAFPEINGAFNYQVAPKSYNPFAMGEMPSVSAMISGDANTDEWFINDATIAGALDGILGGFDLTPKKHTLQWEVTATQPIFAQGKVKTGIEIAEVYQSMLLTQIEDKKYSIAHEVTSAYNSALLAQESKTIREEAVTLAEESHSLAVKRFEAGRGTQLDTLSSRYTLQNEQFQLRDAAKMVTLAKQNLLTLISMEGDAAELTLSDDMSSSAYPVSREMASQTMHSQNSALQMIDKSMTLQQKQTYLAKTDYFPIIAAGGSVGQISQFDKANEISFDEDAWDIKLFASVQVPIWHGGQRKHRLAQARFEETKVSIKRDDAINQLELGLTAAYEDLALAQEDLKQVKEMRELTEKALKVAELSYEIGQITQLELNETSQKLSMVKLAESNAKFKAAQAIVTIKRLSGDATLIATK